MLCQYSMTYCEDPELNLKALVFTSPTAFEDLPHDMREHAGHDRHTILANTFQTLANAPVALSHALLKDGQWS